MNQTEDNKTSQQVIDEMFMRRCLQLARNGQQNAKPNPMVGAVIVVPRGEREARGERREERSWEGVENEGWRIIGEGYHARCGEAHAEVNAFLSVSREDEPLLKEATIYVSLEPCAHYGKTPPCADLIVSKGVRRVVVGSIDPFAQVQGRGIRKLRDAGIEVTVGVLRQECEELNKRFFTFHRSQRPYIILKWAQTANGFLDDNFRPVAISTPFTQMLGHKLRAEEDAILIGRVTDEREHPLLTVRHWHGPNPKRLVVDHQHPLNLHSLYTQNVQSLIVEGGAYTLQRFLDDDLWDEIRVETGTITVTGGTRAPLLPANAKVKTTEHYDGNTIVTYQRI
ncbi:MAG: bifunctional diaminohydroxyphosphoribosylaminopyrimidine deaminase/5-amino-6-(5-phosphoribosylamino)uracil reductase RibD [Prevotella sp.]|nr:bifunctional diaminohydroxyphosphoribosylaminopyrimidine deaminase/5-amino-6-(5-phosphoribosylamino)uracil reductase RibD [Prevotella sp.]